MSQTLPRVEELRRLADEVGALATKPNPTQRDFWQALDKLQRYADTLGEMADDLPEYDGRITIARAGVGIRFEDVDAMVNYLVEGVQNGK